MRKKNHTLPQFCRALAEHDDYLLSCHVLPEGDAIGSILALHSLLGRLGKKSTVVCEDAFPERLECIFSNHWNRVCDLRPRRPFQSLMLADCANLERIGQVQSLLAPATVIFNIDHHVSNDLFGHYNYVRPAAGASGEVIMDIFKHFKLPLTRKEATYLYVSINTDTGSFKYGNTTARSHQLAAELIGVGIDLEKINDGLYATYSLGKMNLYSRLFQRVQTASRGRLAWVAMHSRDLRESGATYEDTEGFIDYLRYMKEVKVAFFLSELPGKNLVRVSMRSKDDYDVNRIASHFGGGGHKKASGCVIEAPLEEAQKRVLQHVRKAFHFSS